MNLPDPRTGNALRIFAVIGLLSVLAASGGALAFGLVLSRPAQSIVGAPPPALGAEPVLFPSASGAMLHGWFVPGQAGAGAVVLLHGVRGNRLAMLQRALVLKRQGFGVVLFDFQAHGESPGHRITFGQLEGKDAAAAVDFLKSRMPHERIGAIGVSLGGAACLLAPKPLGVNALDLESVFPDIGSALADRLLARLGPVAGPVANFVLGPLFRLQMPIVLDVRFEDLQPIARIRTVQAPLLIASGTADAYTPIGEAHALFDQAPEPKTFWPVQGATHQDLERYDPSAYWQHVLPFLTAHLRTAP